VDGSLSLFLLATYLLPPPPPPFAFLLSGNFNGKEICARCLSLWNEWSSEVVVVFFARTEQPTSRLKEVNLVMEILRN
jgi:hypothetical protein